MRGYLCKNLSAEDILRRLKFSDNCNRGWVIKRTGNNKGKNTPVQMHALINHDGDNQYIDIHADILEDGKHKAKRKSDRTSAWYALFEQIDNDQPLEISEGLLKSYNSLLNAQHKIIK